MFVLSTAHDVPVSNMGSVPHGSKSDLVGCLHPTTLQGFPDADLQGVPDADLVVNAEVLEGHRTYANM